MGHPILDHKDTATLMQFEQQLQLSLLPVSPDPEFVYTLKKKLVTPDMVIYERQSKAYSLLIIALGMLAGVLILMVSRRLYYTIFK